MYHLGQGPTLDLHEGAENLSANDGRLLLVGALMKWLGYSSLGKLQAVTGPEIQCKLAALGVQLQSTIQ